MSIADYYGRKGQYTERGWLYFSYSKTFTIGPTSKGRRYTEAKLK